jgi:hypothetical protein
VRPCGVYQGTIDTFVLSFYKRISKLALVLVENSIDVRLRCPRRIINKRKDSLDLVSRCGSSLYSAYSQCAIKHFAYADTTLITYYLTTQLDIRIRRKRFPHSTMHEDLKGTGFQKKLSVKLYDDLRRANFKHSFFGMRSDYQGIR